MSNVRPDPGGGGVFIQFCSLKVLWWAVLLHVTALIFIFHYQLVVLAYFVLVCFALYSFLAAVLMLLKHKNKNLAGAYLLASIVIVMTSLPPVASELERFRYWLKIALDQQRYESDVTKFPVGKDGYRRGQWDWGPDPDGGDIELIYDESDKLPIPSGGDPSVTCVQFPPQHIVGHFYFVRTACPGFL